MLSSPLLSSQTLRATSSPTNCADAAGCTTEGHNTHKTGFREVRYRWHPWHGQSVVVRGESRRGNLVVLQCVRDGLPECRTLEIPEWMFDAAVCGEMRSTQLPHVECAALLALKYLLSAASGPSQRDVVQAQHHAGIAGGADEEAIAVPPSERVVSSTRGTPRVTGRGASEDDSPTGQNVERTLAAAFLCHTSGGGR
jgi:hypothetical protein